jgi:hypothetical protein
MQTSGYSGTALAKRLGIFATARTAQRRQRTQGPPRRQRLPRS